MYICYSKTISVLERVDEETEKFILKEDDKNTIYYYLQYLAVYYRLFLIVSK